MKISTANRSRRKDRRGRRPLRDSRLPRARGSCRANARLMRSSLPSVSRPPPPRGKQVRRLPIHLAANAVCGPLPKGSGAQSGAAAEIASCLLLPPAAAGRDPLRKCRSAAIISQFGTTTGWIKGGENSPPLPFQLGGFQRGEEIGIFPPLACFLFLSTFSLHEQRENGL